jgi:hypothetical protein
MLQESLQSLEGQMNDTVQDVAMVDMDPNMIGQKNGLKNYGFDAQTYR